MEQKEQTHGQMIFEAFQDNKKGMSSLLEEKKITYNIPIVEYIVVDIF